MEIEQSQAKKKVQALWLGPDWQTENSESFEIQRASVQEALELVTQKQISAIFIELNEMNLISQYEQLFWYSPLTRIILITKNFNEEIVRAGINQLKCFRILKHPIDKMSIHRILSEVIEDSTYEREREDLLKEYSSQNKKLEQLTLDLENSVNERTNHLEVSASEEAEKLSKERQIIRFINELATQESVKDILQVLRKEMRKFHKIQNFTLAWAQEKERTCFFEFRGNRFVFSDNKNDMYFNFRENDLNEEQMRQIFANQLGRPLGKALYFPMRFKLVNQAHDFQSEGVLCFEYSLMSEAELQEVRDFLNDRIQSIAIVLDRVILEKHLELSSSRWEKTFDGIRDPLAILSSDGQVIRCNSKFSNDLLIAPVNGEIEVNKKIYRVLSYPIKFDDQGQYTNLINHYIDVTQAREVYLRMLQSEKMGAIGQLAGHIAHELNNPLTGIRSLAQVLMSEHKPEEQIYQDLQHIENSASRCQLIIQYLLDFSRGETNSTIKISVDEIVERTLPMVKTVLRQHRYSLDLHSRDFLVEIEPHLLQQVVFNLVNNACQAMKEPGQITLSTRMMGIKGGQVELKITDTGPGIPLEIQPRIFEPFFTTKKDGHGTGLGLSTAQMIVKKFNGTLSFESDGRSGTSFIIRLPVFMEKK